MSNQRNESNKHADIRTTQSSSSISSNKFKNNRSRKRQFGIEQKSYKLTNKKRRKNAFVSQPKFFLGGNISDPLNLKSIKANDQQNKIRSETKSIDVLIPPNIEDPLNLANAESLSESDLVRIPEKNKRNKRKRTSSESEICHISSEPKKTNVIKDDSYINQQSYSQHNNQDKTNQVVSSIGPSESNKSKPLNCDNKTSDFANKSSETQILQQSVSSENKDSKGNKKVSNNSKQNQKERFRYGNYNRYYGYRNIDHTTDPRLKIFKKEFFEGKYVLDIGCNVGHVTLLIARDFLPKKIVGIDIDESLILIAKRSLRRYATNKIMKEESFPLSMPILYGPLDPFPNKQDFPNNVTFVDGNYVPENDECLQFQKAEFDTILCLSVTKWIHLNWGDDGVKRMFKRIHLQLNPGGCFILEPQPWSSYLKKSKMTATTLKNFRSIQFKPEHFNEFLLNDIGYESCETLGTPSNPSKGFQRTIFLFRKKKLVD